MQKRLFILLLGTVWLYQAAFAIEKPRQQVSLGWGDMLFETLVFHPGQSFNGIDRHSFGYTGHLFTEYRYHFTDVTSVGFQADFEGIFWKESERTGAARDVRNYNLTFLPDVHFTFLDTEVVDLYAGVGAGVLLALDNARQCEVAPALHLTLIGVQLGRGPWTGTVEFGGLNALLNANKIYMLGSRLVSVSVNYRW